MTNDLIDSLASYDPIGGFSETAGYAFDVDVDVGAEYEDVAPLRRRPLKQPPKPTADKTFTVAIGDASKLIAPGAVEKLRVFPQQMFQLVKIELAQYPAHDAGGLACDAGGPCWWPVELCYVGDRAIGGPQGLHTGSCEPVTCQLGQCIELMVRNPLSVPAAVSGCLVGRTISRASDLTGAEVWHDECGRAYCKVPKAAVPPPLTPAQLEAMCREAAGPVESHCCRCATDLTGAEAWHDERGRVYCKEHFDRYELARRLAVYHGEVVNAVTVDGAVYQRVRIGPDTADPEALVFPSASPGWFWKRIGSNAVAPVKVPEPASIFCVDCGEATPGYLTEAHAGAHCGACVRRHRAGLPDPVAFPAKPSAPRSVVYCEHAPPREVVEHVIVRCGTGLEGGQPVMAPLVWTWAMRQAWERHEALRLRTYNDEGHVFVSAPANPVRNGEVRPPAGVDAYGGEVPLEQEVGGWRCRLCGGWIREVTL